MWGLLLADLAAAPGDPRATGGGRWPMREGLGSASGAVSLTHGLPAPSSMSGPSSGLRIKRRMKGLRQRIEHVVNSR
jgi:hypothetical protein